MDVTTTGRRVRTFVTLLVATGVMLGTVWGGDDDFPFAPFRMYSTSRDLAAPVGDTLVRATHVDGRVTEFKDTARTGVRRAEIEGQLDRFRSDPGLLRHLAAAYLERHQDEPALSEIAVVVRWYEIEDGERTGDFHDEVVASWAP